MGHYPLKPIIDRILAGGVGSAAATPGAADSVVRMEIIEAVYPDRRVRIRGIAVPVSGTARGLRPGQQIPVKWQRGRPELAFAHSARRSQPPAARKRELEAGAPLAVLAPGIVEELFIARPQAGAATEVYFRDPDQVVRLPVREMLANAGFLMSPLSMPEQQAPWNAAQVLFKGGMTFYDEFASVRWGTRADLFHVRLGSWSRHPQQSTIEGSMRAGLAQFREQRINPGASAMVETTHPAGISHMDITKGNVDEIVPGTAPIPLVTIIDTLPLGERLIVGGGTPREERVRGLDGGGGEHIALAGQLQNAHPDGELIRSELRYAVFRIKRDVTKRLTEAPELELLDAFIFDQVLTQAPVELGTIHGIWDREGEVAVQEVVWDKAERFFPGSPSSCPPNVDYKVGSHYGGIRSRLPDVSHQERTSVLSLTGAALAGAQELREFSGTDEILGGMLWAYVLDEIVDATGTMLISLGVELLKLRARFSAEEGLTGNSAALLTSVLLNPVTGWRGLGCDLTSVAPIPAPAYNISEGHAVVVRIGTGGTSLIWGSVGSDVQLAIKKQSSLDLAAAFFSGGSTGVPAPYSNGAIDIAPTFGLGLNFQIAGAYGTVHPLKGVFDNRPGGFAQCIMSAVIPTSGAGRQQTIYVDSPQPMSFGDVGTGAAQFIDQFAPFALFPGNVVIANGLDTLVEEVFPDGAPYLPPVEQRYLDLTLPVSVRIFGVNDEFPAVQPAGARPHMALIDWDATVIDRLHRWRFAVNAIPLKVTANGIETMWLKVTRRHPNLDPGISEFTTTGGSDGKWITAYEREPNDPADRRMITRSASSSCYGTSSAQVGPLSLKVDGVELDSSPDQYDDGQSRPPKTLLITQYGRRALNDCAVYLYNPIEGIIATLIAPFRKYCDPFPITWNNEYVLWTDRSAPNFFRAVALPFIIADPAFYITRLDTGETTPVGTVALAPIRVGLTQFPQTLFSAGALKPVEFLRPFAAAYHTQEEKFVEVTNNAGVVVLSPSSVAEDETLAPLKALKALPFGVSPLALGAHGTHFRAGYGGVGTPAFDAGGDGTALGYPVVDIAQAPHANFRRVGSFQAIPDELQLSLVGLA